MKNLLAIDIPQPIPPQGEGITNPALSERLRTILALWGGIGFLERFINNLLTLILIAASLVAFFFLIIGGIRYIASGGDKEATEQARSQITKAVVGLVLVFISYAIIKLIGEILGISLLEISLEPLMLK